MTEEQAPPSLRPDPGLVQEVFDKDPMKLTDRDLDVIIAEFRADRRDYLQPKEAKAPKTAKAKAAKIDAAVDLLPGLSLDDLGL